MESIEPRFYGYAFATRGDGYPARYAVLFGLPVLALLLAVFAVSSLGWPRWTVTPALVAMALLSPTVLRGALCAGVRADARGLRLCYPWGFGRSYGWEELTDVGLADGIVTLHLRGGELRLRRNLKDRLHLVAQCRRALGHAEAPEADGEAEFVVPPEEVAHWLGVGIDGALTCRSHLRRRMLPLCALLAGFSALLPGRLPLLSMSALMAGLVLWASRRVIGEVRATPTALEVRTGSRRRRYAWGSLRQLDQREGHWIIQTVDGDLRLPPSMGGKEKLLEAVRNAIEARGRGLALPRLSADVPEAALSRAGAGAVDVERGLSHVDDNG